MMPPMMTPIRRHGALVLFLLVCAMGPLSSVWTLPDRGNTLSSLDPATEANELREVRHFLEDGLLKYQGLGKVLYPGLYDNEGFAPLFRDAEKWDAEPENAPYHAEHVYNRQHVVTKDGVYTHFPPGPEYLLYAAAKLLGPEPVWRLRLLPIALGSASMIFLGLAIRRRFNPLPAWAVMSALAATPSARDLFVGLDSEAYSLALLMVECGVLLGRRAGFLACAVLGFLHGWMSFDFAFLTALSPLAIEAAMPRIDPSYRANWRQALTRAVLAGGGFILRICCISPRSGLIGAVWPAR